MKDSCTTCKSCGYRDTCGIDESRNPDSARTWREILGAPDPGLAPRRYAPRRQPRAILLRPFGAPDFGRLSRLRTILIQQTSNRRAEGSRTKAMQATPDVVSIDRDFGKASAFVDGSQVSEGARLMAKTLCR